MHSPDKPSEPHTLSWLPDPDEGPLANGLILAHIARLAYVDSLDHPTEGPVEAQAEASGFCAAFPTVRPIDSDRVRGFVAGDDDRVVVAFAGTHRSDHWRDSLRYDQALGFGGWAHRGFADVLDTVMPAVLAGLYDTRALAKTLWLTGHSLGGALALLAGWRLHHTGFEPRAVCTFGAPPVLDATAADAYPIEMWRFANDGDWVPHMQWPRVRRAYTHAGTPFVLLRSGRLAPSHRSSSVARRMDRFDRLEEPTDYGGPFVDHNLKEYIRRLVANIESTS